MANNDGKTGFLSEGSTVEVAIEGAWYEAHVVTKCADSEDQFRVSSADGNNWQPTLRSVNVSSIRPRPPSLAAHPGYEPGDVVDILDGVGWWKGVVSGVYMLRGKTRYTVVLFENPPHYADRIFKSEEMRFHWVWTHDGQWVRPRKTKEILDLGEESSTSETMVDNENQIGFLSQGLTVEVKYEGAWYKAHILAQCPKSKDQFRVSCKKSSFEENVLNVNISEIRPRPLPPAAKQSYEPCDVVDVLHDYGWWKGVVSGVYMLKREISYTVILFENPPHYADRIFTSNEIRFHMIWTHDAKWVRPPKSEISGLDKQPSRRKTSNTTPPDTIETLSNNPTESRKENHVISSTPEDFLETPKAMKSTCDSGGNLMGKNPVSTFHELLLHDFQLNEADTVLDPILSKRIPKRLETGLKARLGKYSKKRPRELNAHFTNHKVLAAGNTNDDLAKVTKKGNFHHSYEVNAQEQSELARKKDLPFKKSSYLWKAIDSLDVFKVLPQSPHFSPLMDCNEDTREAIAIGHMWNFAFLAEKVSKLQIEDPGSLFERYLKALAVLETVGFDVKIVVDRIKELLAIKTKQEQLAVELSSLNDMFKVKADASWENL